MGKPLFEDLDKLLNQSQKSQQQPANASSQQSIGTGTSINLVGVVMDDSESMSNITEELKSGMRDMLKDLEKSASKKRIYLILVGFRGTYFNGPVDNDDHSYSWIDKILDRYSPSYGSTPLVYTSIQLLESIHKKEEEYARSGISSSVNMLMMTDGEDNGDHNPEDFQERITKSFRHWRVYGMGIAPKDDSYAEKKRFFLDFFKRMGVNNIDPSSRELGVALMKFSKSVAR